MAFNATLEMTGNTAKISLSGELDATAAPTFKQEIDKAAAEQAKRLVLLVQNLEYIASAGIRVLVMAKQKMGADVEIYVIAPQDQVMETIEMTGLHHSLHILDEYDDNKIEGS
jgi:anti-anti-sigma factor